MICSQSRKYSLSRRLFTFFEYIIHPLDKYCQRFPLPLPLFSVGLCLLLSFHSLRLSTERLFYVKTKADGKSPPAPHWLLRNRALRLRFLMQIFYYTLIIGFITTHFFIYTASSCRSLPHSKSHPSYRSDFCCGGALAT